MNCNYKSICTTSPNDIYCYLDGYVCDEICTNHINNYINERDKILHEKLILINNELDEIEEKLIEAKLKKRIEKRKTK